jgi:hypothetical protein
LQGVALPAEFDEATELLLDFLSVLEQDGGLDPADEPAELSWISPLMTLDEDVSVEESSSWRGAKLLSSSPQAVRHKAQARIAMDPIVLRAPG